MARFENARIWRHVDYGLMWTILADSDREAIGLLISLSLLPV